MKNNKEYWGKTRRRTLGLIMLVGCMILFGVFELSAESDLKDAQKRVEDKQNILKHSILHIRNTMHQCHQEP